MNCVVCHSPEIEVKKLNEEIKINSDIIFVPISTPVCNNCGERYYDRKTMRFLEKTEDKLKKQQLPLREIGKVMILE